MMKLNPQQQAAVNKIEGPVIVLAGPGTGKTQIIAARIANILQSTQMDPHNILCLTFTRSGVMAMRKRLIEMIGTAAYHVRIHTFHSFCEDVIKEHPDKFLFQRELEMLTDIERVQLFRRILDDISEKSALKPFGVPYMYQKDLEHIIKNLKRENIQPDTLELALGKIEEFIKAHGAEVEEFISIHGSKLKEADLLSIQKILEKSPLTYLVQDIANLEKKERTKLKNAIKKDYLSLKNQIQKQRDLLIVYRSYQAALKKLGRYDFEDMILFVVQKFQEDEELLAKYQEQFQYILVDEYQDTNAAQNLVVQLIGEFFKNPNIFVVGDEKQSIYRFQGASLENILHFYNLYKDHVDVISLKENYRSQQTILDAADSLISHNEKGLSAYIPNLDQTLHAAKEIPSCKIQVGEFSSVGSEDYFLAKKVEELIQGGTSPSEIAIFYRNNRDADDIVDLFLRLGVPFRLEAGKDILKDHQLNKLITLLHFIHNFDSSELLFYILHFDFLGFANLDIAKLTRLAANKRKSIFELMMEEDALIDADISNPQALTDFAKNCMEWQSMSINLPFMDFFDHLIKESGYLDFVLQHKDKVEHLNRLNTLFDFIKKENRADHTLNLADFAAHLNLLEENDIQIAEHELKTQEDAVRLMTAHKSKGLEFEYVFITKFVDKHWGNKIHPERIQLPQGLLETEPKNDNEEERRLFYVALTRAKKEVYITYSNKNANDKDQVPSIFLTEVAADYLKQIQTQTIEEEANDRLQTIFLAPKVSEPDIYEQDFVRGLLENYTMSVTHLNNYLRCPRYFYYQNLLRVPASMGSYVALGSAIHESLKDITNAPEKGKDFLLESFEKHMKRQVLSQQDFRSGLELGRKSLDAYYDEFHDRLGMEGMSEYNFSSHGVNLDGIPLTGKLDRIEILDEAKKEVNVIDYKTGDPDKKRQDLEINGDYWRQIAFYQLLCDLSPKFPYKMLSGEINFVQPSKRTGKFKNHKYKISKEEMDMLKSTIKDVYEDIKNLRFLNPGDTACGECDYCQFVKTLK